MTKTPCCDLCHLFDECKNAGCGCHAHDKPQRDTTPHDSHQPSVCGVDCRGLVYDYTCSNPVPCSLHPQQVKGVCCHNTRGCLNEEQDAHMCTTQPPATGEGVEEMLKTFKMYNGTDFCALCGLDPVKLRDGIAKLIKQARVAALEDVLSVLRSDGGLEVAVRDALAEKIQNLSKPQ